jgi:hypothetical protein
VTTHALRLSHIIAAVLRCLLPMIWECRVRPPRSFAQIAELAAAGATLVLLLLYTYANFFALPYVGLNFVEASGHVISVYVPGPVVDDDVLVTIADVRLADSYRGRAPRPFHDTQPGQVVMIELQRGGQTLTVPWTLPGFNWNEFFYARLTNQWLLAYAFWIIGAFVLLGLRPRQRLQRLFAAFCFLTTLWIIASVVSRTQLWYSAEVLRAAIWLCVPVYWHLHWDFPERLRSVPRWLGLGLYGVFGVLALADWLHLIPPTLYPLALLLAPAGSLVFLIGHLIWQPRTRRAAFTLVGVALLCLVPAVALGISSVLLGLGSDVVLGALLALPLLPIAYLVAIYRHRFGGLELRVNRAISIYLFGLVVLTILALAGAVMETRLAGEHSGTIMALVVGVGSVTIAGTVWGFGPFQRLVERRLLGVPPVPAHLLVAFGSRLGTCLDVASLTRLVRDEVQPALVVRQAALLSQDAEGHWRELFNQDAPAVSDTEAEALLREGGRYRQPGSVGQPSSWVRLALPLRATGQPPGLWLLGRRDPDDFYAATEIPI